MSRIEKDTRPGRSTGPRSAEGKQNSSRNAATHGLSSIKFFLIPGETEEEFEAHAQVWAGEYEAFDSPLLQPLLQDVIQAHWLQKRAYKRVFESEMALALAETNREPPDVVEEVFKRLQRMLRYKTTYENSFQRAFRSIEAFRKRHVNESMSTVRARQANHSMAASAAKFLQRMLDCGSTPEQAREKLAILCPEYRQLPEEDPPPAG